MFFKGSRYARVATVETADGRKVKYKKVRLPDDPPLLTTHIVSQGERLDLLAHRYLRDSERFWRICDANGALWPESLLARIGRRIRIPTPEG